MKKSINTAFLWKLNHLPVQTYGIVEIDHRVFIIVELVYRFI